MPRSHIGPARGLDAASVLTSYVTLLFLVPAAMIVGALGTAGAPATIMAIVTFFWWLWFHIQRDEPLVAGPQPVRNAMLLWLFVMLVVYVHAMSSPIPAGEISPADSGLLRLLGMAGLLLVANDGLSSLVRCRTLARRLVIGVGILALFGLFQYATRQLWIDRISIPGLTPGTSAWTLSERSGFARPSGTSTHPIEFGVVLTMVLPLVVVFAVSAPTRRGLYRVLLGAVAFAVFLSISRSAIICAAVALVVVASGWSVAARIRALLILFGLTVVVYLTVPGLMGTITGMFTGISEDSSVQSRTGSYEVAVQFIERSPVFGRGFGTFLPDYWILDNGYLGLMIDSGILGIVGLLMVIGTALYAARRASQRLEDEFDKELARGVLAAVAAGASGFAFFDTFAFPQSAGTFFLIVGLGGAMLRLSRPLAGSSSRTPTTLRRSVLPSPPSGLATE